MYINIFVLITSYNLLLPASLVIIIIIIMIIIIITESRPHRPMKLAI